MAAGTGFPYVLYDLLKKESSTVVMWTSTGTAFGIRDMQSFRQDVLTCYFKHNKFSSFQRQLNLYGFRKVVKGRESGCYMHPSFLRDHPEKLTEVKRGVVPPCPSHYSRKIYGSGPRFMNQDDGSDSEPELMVQPRGHWEKDVGASEMATHMRLGEMHISAAALAAARAQIKADGQDVANSGHAAAVAAAAAHHLRVAQAHIGGSGCGVPLHDNRGNTMAPNNHMMGAGGSHIPQQHVPQQHQQAANRGAVGFGPGPADGGMGMGGGGGAGGGGLGGEASRARAGRSTLSKMFGGKRQSPSVPSSSMAEPYARGGGGGGSGVGLGVGASESHCMQLPTSRGFESLSPSDPQQIRGSGRDVVHNPSAFGGMPPMLACAAGQEGGLMASRGMSGGDGSGWMKQPSQSTVLSLSRLLDGLGQTLDSPLEEELYTPIDRRNSFCAQMVSIAQALEEDPSMQVMQEQKNSQLSNLAQKRRSSVSELAAYLHDMLEDGESNRMVPTHPGWLLNVPTSQGSGSSDDFHSGGGRDGIGNGATAPRVTFKRTHGGDGNEGYTGAAEDRAESGVSMTGADAGFAKRVKGSPLSAPASTTPTDGGAAGAIEDVAKPPGLTTKTSARRLSETGRIGVGASPTVVQALTCLASGLANSSSSSDSEGEGNGEQPVAGPAGAGGGGEGIGRSPWSPTASSSVATPAPATCNDTSVRSGRSGGKMEVSVKVEKEEGAGGATEGGSTVVGEAGKAEGGAATGDGGGSGEKEGDGGEQNKNAVPAKRANPIADVLTNFSLDRALQQFKSDQGGVDCAAENDGDEAEAAQPTMRQRASVYVLMHAIAAVDTAGGDEWEDAEGILDGEEAATVAAAI